MTQEQEQNLPADVAKQDSIGGMLMRLMNVKHLGEVAKRCVQVGKNDGLDALWDEIAFRINLALGRDGWHYRADFPTQRLLNQQRKQGVAGGPSFSVVVPLYNTPVLFLRQLLNSVIGQSYQNWQLVLVDASDDAHKDVEKVATKYANKDARILYQRLEQNAGIAANTNAGLALATGDWIALLDHDDLLYKNALHEIAQEAANGADFVYTDEIVLSANLKNVVNYHFKPDFSPDYLRGCNYITHLSAFSRTLLQKAGGGEDSAYDGSQDFDLILRLTEQAAKIKHIPKAMYIWRSHQNSTASSMDTKPYALLAGEKAVDAHLQRIGLAGKASYQPQFPGSYRIQYAIKGDPLISVIIPNKDHVEDLSRCLASLYAKAGQTNFEVIVVENNSTNAETFAFYETATAQYKRLQVVKYEGAFNFSAINNFGRKAANGEHLLLLNNDIEVLSDNFLTEMLMYSQRDDVGCVGAKLYFPDETIQHAGVFLGINQTAGHSHKGHPADSSGDMYRLVTAQNMMAVTGACLMVKAALYDAAGGLDEENFAVAYNDVDLCLKLWQGGLLNVFTPFADAYHYESKSRGLDTKAENQARYEGEKRRFMQKYADLIAAGDPYYNRHFNLLFENYGLK